MYIYIYIYNVYIYYIYVYICRIKAKRSLEKVFGVVHFAFCQNVQRIVAVAEMHYKLCNERGEP